MSSKKIQIFDTSEGDADVGGISLLPALADIGEKSGKKTEASQAVLHNLLPLLKMRP